MAGFYLYDANTGKHMKVTDSTDLIYLDGSDDPADVAYALSPERDDLQESVVYHGSFRQVGISFPTLLLVDPTEKPHVLTYTPGDNA